MKVGCRALRSLLPHFLSTPSYREWQDMTQALLFLQRDLGMAYNIAAQYSSDLARPLSYMEQSQ